MSSPRPPPSCKTFTFRPTFDHLPPIYAPASLGFLFFPPPSFVEYFSRTLPLTGLDFSFGFRFFPFLLARSIFSFPGQSGLDSFLFHFPCFVVALPLFFFFDNDSRSVHVGVPDNKSSPRPLSPPYREDRFSLVLLSCFFPQPLCLCPGWTLVEAVSPPVHFRST